jgi:signal transduction histidine kinase
MIERLNRLAATLVNGWVITGLVLVITFLHLATRVDALGIHEMLRRLYYLPIILAAYRYGISGGFTVSVISGLAYAPHILLYTGKPEIQIVNQLLEILLFLIVGTVTGILSELEQRRSRQLELQLEEVQRLENEVRIADRLAAVGQLASGVAHEIRNPLGIIRAAAQLAKADDEITPDIDESVSVVLKEVDRANQVVARLLDFARPRFPSFELINLLGVIDEAVRLTRQYAANSGVNLIDDLPSGEIPVEADAGQIKQVLVNLFLNAVQATPSKGSVTIRLGPHKHEGRPGYLVEITDTGKGIPPEVIDKIFDPFYTTKDTGTGLGLSIVYSIVRDHGGSIRVFSEEGEGTSVDLWLPQDQKGVQ